MKLTFGIFGAACIMGTIMGASETGANNASILQVTVAPPCRAKLEPADFPLTPI